MKAALLEEVPGELVIDDVQLGAIGPRDVLVRTVAAGLCHSDLHFMEGKYPCPVPAVLGHESAGVVEAVGDQVTYLSPGENYSAPLTFDVRSTHGVLSYAPDGSPAVSWRF